MKSLNSFINFRSSRPNLQSSYISLDRWLTVGSPSGLDAKWKQNPFMRFAVVLTLIFSIGMGNAWGADKTVTWTATNGALGNNTVTTTTNATGNISTGSYSWDYTRSYYSHTSTNTDAVGWQGPNGGKKYIQLGKNGFVEELTLTTSNIPGTIKSVTVDCASYSAKHNVAISVGGTSYLSSTATPSWSNNTGGTKTGTGTSSGTITISFTGTGDSRALYINSVSVTYNNDAPAAKYTVSFDTGTGNPSQADITEASGGAGITLPAGPTPTCSGDGWSFAGWKETSAVTSETTVAPTLLSAGSTYHPTGNVTLYAVYAKEGYAREKSSITSGSKYLIVANYDSKNYVMTDSYSLDGDSEGHMDSEQVDEDEDDFYLASSIDSDWRYSIEGTPSHYDIRDVKNSSSENYLDIAYKNWYGKDNDDTDEWIITVSSGNWTLQNEYHSNYLAFNTTNKVFERRSGTVWLYKQVTVYFSNPTCCTPLGSVNGSITLSNEEAVQNRLSFSYYISISKIILQNVSA